MRQGCDKECDKGRSSSKRKSESVKCGSQCSYNDRARSNGQVDQTSRDAQVDQVNQNQLSSMASAVELSRGGENQQQGPRMKQENKTLPSTSRQAS